jgi:pimeloyl-ACP methyl ester carboxylesterase
MKQIKYITLTLIALSLFACQKESITISNNANDTFFLKNKGVQMPIKVCGNTASKTFMLIVHGGPGGDAIVYRSNYVKQNVETKCAVAYWDQRAAGASQGAYNNNNFTLESFVDDMRQVILLLKQRYGADISVFVNGHSWGGYITPAFLGTNNNQDLVKGWIHTDGAHDFTLLNKFSKDRLLEKASIEINANKNVAEWTKTKNYCNALSLPLDVNEWVAFNEVGTKAMGITTEVARSVTSPSGITRYLDNDAPIVPIILQGIYNPVTFRMIKDLYPRIPTVPNLDKITVPTLILFGKYDYICPLELADDITTKIKSAYKKTVIFENSAHSPMVTEEPAYWQEIIQFINIFK